MEHIVMSKAFEYGEEPFPAFRANLVYGRNKRDREFLPVKDVRPEVQYLVTAAGTERKVLYAGADKDAAERAKANYDAGEKLSRAVLQESPAILPKGKFRVIKTREKGTILVVPGRDDTNRCLLFVGCAGGFRGGVSLVAEGTTGEVLKKCSAGNNCESSLEVIALLEEGQSVAFHTTGRRTNEVLLYTWNGQEVERKHFSKPEWDARTVSEDEDYEIL